MLDQSFSVKNFKKIFYDENRKGKYIEGKYFPELKVYSSNITSINQDFKTLKSNKKQGVISQEEYEIQKNEKNIFKELILKEKEEKLTALLPEITEKIISKNFKIEIDKTEDINGKDTYSIQSKAEYFFAVKQLQKNVRNSFKVKQADRLKILRQVEKLLSDGCPKYILRTDIKGFYESIPHDKLNEKINKNLTFSQLSKKILRGLLWEYKDKSFSQTNGIPRGVGVSAYLAELYMQDIDSKIMSYPNVTYYARYVDDIILIITPQRRNENTDYLNEVNGIKMIVEKDTGLVLNETKTDIFDLRTGVGSYSFNFLGYKLSGKNDSNKAKLCFSNEKCRKYRSRIDETFKYYSIDSKHDEKRARKILINRLRFLTQNTHLNNAKSNVLVGVYFSNVLLSDLKDLEGLDFYLNHKIGNLNPYEKLNIDLPKLRARLSKFSFEKGFKNKQYTKFTTNQLKEILKIWKPKNATQKT